MSISAEELYAGRYLGDYELVLPLAQGATASVWAARMKSSGLEKIVAIKTMLTEYNGDSETESMFLDEARLVSRIRHPNVAAVLDLGEADETLYIVMEWVDGEPLQVLMREAKAKGIPLPLAVRIAKLAAGGLHAAHELCDEAGKPLKLVHRDVSPQNILIGFDGAVKVIDFGVAKALSNVQRTTVGQIKGKVPYMAPEQAIGDPVDRRTDVFALGTVLYQMVTGKHPFRADNEFATLARLRDPKPVDPPSTHVAVPPELEQVMLKALAKNRDQRFATMFELARALDKAMPSAPDDEQVLGALVRGLLATRGAKRYKDIREALSSLGHTKRPVNLSHLFDEEPSKGSSTPLAPAGAALAPAPASTSTPAPVAPAPAATPEPVVAPAQPAAQPAAAAQPPPVASAPLPAPRESLPVIPGMNPQERQNKIKLIVAAICVFLAISIALLAMLGGDKGAGPDDGRPTKRAF